MTKPFHGGNLTAIQNKYALDKATILDFSASISPFGPPQAVKQAIINSIGEIQNYPDPDCLELRRAIAAHWQIEPHNILVGNGSTELIHLLVRMLNPHRALIPAPTFAEYEDAVRLSGGGCLFVTARPDVYFSWPTKKIVRRLAKVDLLFLCTPNSPTGYLMPYEEVSEIIRASRSQNTMVVIDETFLDFVEPSQASSFVPLAARSPGILVLRSFTKLYSLPGLRLGYLVGGKTLLRKISRLQPPWMVNALAQAAGVKALQDKTYAIQTVERLNREKKWLMTELSETPGLFPYPSAANFILCRLTSEKLDATSLTDKMAQKGILIRDCTSYRGLGKQFIRMAVRTREENTRMLAALREVLDGV